MRCWGRSAAAAPCWLSHWATSSSAGREGLGLGDVKMLAMIGAFLGWPLAFVTLAWASLLGATVGIGMLRFNGFGWQHPLPLGSFLAFAAVAASLVGARFLDWYLGASGRLLNQLVGAP